MSNKYPPNILLKKERERRGWTHTYVAEKIGLPDPRSVGRWEQGLIFPSPRYRHELCRVFGKSVAELGLLKPQQDNNLADFFEEIALQQSIVRKQWLPLDVAVREVLTFEKLFGTGHFLLACHAALPSLLTPELLHSIRINFLDQQKPHTPWIAEMDFLLSPLCHPIEKDLFEVESMVREALLFKLEERYGWQQLQNVADFLLQYLHKNHESKRNAGMMQLHEWIARSYLQPDKIVQELTDLLNESVDPQSNDYQKLPKKLRIARTMELLADPLRRTLPQEEYAGLVHSARVLAYTLYSNKATFPTRIRATGSASERGSTLFPPAVQQWLSTLAASQTTGETSVETSENGDALLVALPPIQPELVRYPTPPKRIDTSFMQPDMVLVPADLSAFREQNPKVQITPDQWRILTCTDGLNSLQMACQLLGLSPDVVCVLAGELLAEGLIYVVLPARHNMVYSLFSAWLTSQQRSRPTPFTGGQILWLERIRDRIATNGKFEKQDFNHSPFEFDGGLVAARSLFGKELPAILRELNKVLGDVQRTGASSWPVPTHTELTAREMEVLRLLAQGLTNAQIAEKLAISVSTFNMHLRSIYSKLGVTSRAAATRYAIEHHLV